jgi:hypothetical protein
MRGDLRRGLLHPDLGPEIDPELEKNFAREMDILHCTALQMPKN